ncbi:sulfotransferase 1E1-like isoform X2 [Ostrea edulis]|uniref:sulfotransferase 1E1-like isoform X2 n=1 Tax=Ostrea edulis TaxID=37623 RepID=UPI0020962582|nr:sulfotransferase 1E1-like isoform X2 [Ostrea edulis]
MSFPTKTDSAGIALLVDNYIQILLNGTHWVWEIVCMLLKNKAEYVKEIKEFSFLESIPDIKALDDIASPRALNTHAPYRWLPKQHLENGGKIIHVVRNPKDIAVSMFFHLGNSKDRPRPTDFKTFCEMLYMGPVPPYGGWYAFEKEYEQAKEKETLAAIFTVHYESIKKNPIQEIKRLAKYLDVDVKDDVVAEIADKCSFRKLKEADATLKDYSVMTKVNPKAKEALSKMYRKGEIGDWKNHFTVAMNERFDARFKEEMKDSKIEVQFE